MDSPSRTFGFLASVPAFAGLDADQLERLYGCTVLKVIAKGETAVAAGAAVNELAIVVSGRMAAEGGGPETVEFGQGAALNAEAFFTQTPAAAALIALRETVLLTLARDDLTAAFQAHPYHRPTAGWMSDLNSFSATDAEKFFHEYYIPSNMVVAVVGDVKAAQAMPMIEKYFDRIRSGPAPDERTTSEPPQNSERRVVLHEMAQPIYLEGYHRPDYRNPDDAVYDAIADLMSNGRTSRLYRALVRDKRIASDSAGFSGLPGTKYPHLFAFYAVPLPGHKPEEMADAIHAEIEKIKNADISDAELKMIKTRAKANLLRGLADNEGLAFQLGKAQAAYGDWRELFREVDRIEKVTKADIRRVATQTFVPTNRTVGIIESVAPAAAGTQGGAQ